LSFCFSDFIFTFSSIGLLFVSTTGRGSAVSFLTDLILTLERDNSSSDIDEGLLS
jgi:hypothetical protein